MAINKENNEFPLKEIIDYDGNRYELAKACMKRVYSLLIEEAKKIEVKGSEANKVVNTGSKGDKSFKREKKITGIAMTDILHKRIKFYNERENS